MFSLQGNKALIIGIANEHSIAYGCAKALRAQGRRCDVDSMRFKRCLEWYKHDSREGDFFAEHI